MGTHPDDKFETVLEATLKGTQQLKEMKKWTNYAIKHYDIKTEMPICKRILYIISLAFIVSILPIAFPFGCPYDVHNVSGYVNNIGYFLGYCGIGW